MGINNYTVFTIHCDTCNNVLDNEHFYPIQEDTILNIIAVAKDKKWQINKGKCICPKCLTKLNELKTK